MSKKKKKFWKPKIHWLDISGGTQPETFLKFLSNFQRWNKIPLEDLKEKFSFANVIQNEHHQPLVLYHGTYVNFEKFNPLTHFGTFYAAIDIVINKLRPAGNTNSEYETYSKIKEKKLPFPFWLSLWRAQNAKLIPVCLNIHRPLMIVDLHEHNLISYKNLVLNELEKDLYTDVMLQKFPLLKSFAIANILLNYKVRTASPVYNMIFKDPFEMSPEQVKRELSLERLFKVKKNNQEKYLEDCDWINRENLVWQRMIRFFERRGFDGFVYVNDFEDKNSLSYIVFRPEQVIRLDRKLPVKLKLNPSKENEARLSVLELKALNRCADKWLDWNDRKQRQAFQESIVKSLPKTVISQNQGVAEAISNYFKKRHLRVEYCLGSKKYLRLMEKIKRIEKAHA